VKKSFEMAYLKDRNNIEHLEFFKVALVVDRRADIRYYYPFDSVVESANL
jgi:hypothetical protein